MSRVLQYKRFFVTGADCALRYGLLILFFGPACSRSAALGSLNHVLRTRVQSEYCASVSFYLFWDTDAVGVLRYGLLILFFGPACSWQRSQNTAKFPMNNHANLPCLRQSRRRQTSLALKAPRAFNPKQAQRIEVTSRALCSSKSSIRKSTSVIFLAN